MNELQSTMMHSCFSASQILQFENEGWVVGEGMFPRELALQLRAKILNEALINQATLEHPQSLIMVYDSFDDQIWSSIRTNRLYHAINSLAGDHRWHWEKSFGSWPILFPGFSSPPWKPITMSWHIEGRSYLHCLGGAAIALTMILFFSDICPGDGGTAIAVGSHRTVTTILSEAEEGLPQMTVTGRYLQKCPNPEVIEATGKAGDVLFLHPYTIHATSTNTGDHIRVACNSHVLMCEPMRLSCLEVSRLSLIERAVVLNT